MNAITSNMTSNKQNFSEPIYSIRFCLQFFISQDLSENKIGIEGVAAIADVLLNTNNLKRLVLQGKEVFSLLFWQMNSLLN